MEEIYDANTIEGAREALRIAEEIFGGPDDDPQVLSLIHVFKEPEPEWVGQLRESIRLHDEDGVPLDWAHRYTGFLR